MSRTKLFFIMGGVALVAGTAGWACGLLAAPASGKEMRRRLAWRAEEEWRSGSKAALAFVGRVADRARAELEQ